MSTDKKSQAPQSILAEQLSAGLTVIESKLSEHTEEREKAVKDLRRDLLPVIQGATAIRAEYQDLEREFGGILDRMANLDGEALRTVTGAGKLGDLAGEARKIRAELKAAIEAIEKAETAVQTFLGTRAGATTDLVHQTVAQHQHGPKRIQNRLQQFVERLRAFEEAQHN